MTQALISANPFALLMDPQAVIAAVERSERLGHLKSRICRPLDKPLIPHADADTEADAAVDAASDSAEEPGDAQI